MTKNGLVKAVAFIALCIVCFFAGVGIAYVVIHPDFFQQILMSIFGG